MSMVFAMPGQGPPIVQALRQSNGCGQSREADPDPGIRESIRGTSMIRQPADVMPAVCALAACRLS